MLEIHPEVRYLQIFANFAAKDYDIEDCVMSSFNYWIFRCNEMILKISRNYLDEVRKAMAMDQDDFIDFIYSKYNDDVDKWNKNRNTFKNVQIREGFGHYNSKPMKQTPRKHYDDHI